MKAASLKLRAERRARPRGHAPTPLRDDGRQAESREQKFRLPPFALRMRAAVTLVELLVTIVIMAIIGTAIVGASRVAMESSRESKTRTMVTKLHTLMLERVESYQTRRVEFNPEIKRELASLNVNSRDRGMILADARLLAIRELMKLEMPDRWRDMDDPVIVNRSSLSQAYWRRRARIPPPTEQHQGAECLYMIIMMSTGDGEARTLFNQQDIGDTDEDGAPEFLDGWGNPIKFIRWPAGFFEQSDLMSGDPLADHDPFDHFRRDQPGVIVPDLSSYDVPRRRLYYQVKIMRDRHQSGNAITAAFRLVPLIYSAGPSGKSNLVATGDISTDSVNAIDPYFMTPKGYLGGLDDLNSTDHIDNIHNHRLD
jgi:hypothetical protein